MARQSKIDFRTEDEKPFVSDSKLSKLQFLEKYNEHDQEYMQARYKWLHARSGTDAARIWKEEVIPAFNNALKQLIS